MGVTRINCPTKWKLFAVIFAITTRPKKLVEWQKTVKTKGCVAFYLTGSM